MDSKPWKGLEAGVVLGSELKWMVRNIEERETGGPACLSFVETRTEKRSLHRRTNIIIFMHITYKLPCGMWD